MPLVRSQSLYSFEYQSTRSSAATTARFQLSRSVRDRVPNEFCELHSEGAPFLGLSSRLYRGRPFSHDHTSYLPSSPPFRPVSSSSAPLTFKSHGLVPASQQRPV